jgi:nitrous-oxide reductase
LDGDYDGEFLFINDKANPRIAVIDLRDFETKQIVTNENMGTNHGGAFVTPNTEYVIEAAQYSIPLWTDYADESRYREDYRGLVTLWKFDRDAGRIDESRSFSIELPPYWHDLSDAGKGPSFGWAFLNSFNTEMATGGVEDGNPPFESGASQNDMDYMHILNWEKAAEVAAQRGMTRTRNGRRIIPIEVAIEQGLLYLVPEPKSPHGADVTPDGRFVVVSGKLDPHVTIYSWEKMKQAIDDGSSLRSSRASSRWDWARCTPSSTTRAAPTPRSSSIPRSPNGASTRWRSWTTSACTTTWATWRRPRATPNRRTASIWWR